MYNFQPNDIIVPDALDYPEGALRVDSWDGETLTAHPEGGGFGYKFNLDAIKKYDFYVVDIEMTTPRWRKAMFYLGDGPSFVGYHCGHRWNGWACPMFPIESVRAIAEWMNAQGWPSRIEINEKTGTVTILEEDEECNEAEEPETRARNGIPTMALYGVGAYGWTWTEDENEDEDPSEAILNQHYTSCGLNADWCVSAWHVGDNEPNMVSGDIYVVDEEDIDEPARFFVVQRFYTDDNDEIKQLAGPLTAKDAILTCEYYTMTDNQQRTP